MDDAALAIQAMPYSLLSDDEVGQKLASRGLDPTGDRPTRLRLLIEDDHERSRMASMQEAKHSDVDYLGLAPHREYLEGNEQACRELFDDEGEAFKAGFYIGHGVATNAELAEL